MSGIVGQNTGRGSGLVKSGAVGADSVTGSEIADDAIDSEHYTDGSIDNAHIADDAIDSEHYAAASIDNAHLADNAADTAEIADNAITLAKMAGGTDGNVISYDASGDPVAISTGSDGQVLTSTGAGSPPAFEAAAAGGSMVFLLKYTITSTTATMEFSSSYITSAYDCYELIWQDVFNDNTGTTGSRMQFQFGDDGGYHTGDDYYSVQIYTSDTGSGAAGEYVTECAGRLAEAIGSETYKGTSGHMRFYSVFTANVTKYLGMEHHRRAPGGYYQSFPSGRLESATAWNKMQLLWNGDENYEGGTFSLYGIKES